MGFDYADDAGVYLLNEETALVQTVDFFTPIVDDPRTYGRIAAVNSLSDVYAMGGKPLTALNILCYPEELGPMIMREILQGGLEKMGEAGCSLVGGHSVADKELKYGLSVTGTVNPKRIFSNDKAKANQAIVVTKKIGTGIVTTAAKNDACPAALLDEAIQQMETLNSKASEAMLNTRATGCTDITGFGLLGHLSEVIKASKIGARISSSRVPYFFGVEELVRKGFVTKGNRTNREYTGNMVRMDSGVPDVHQKLLFDPQTSGGLIVILPHEDVAQFQKELGSHGQESSVIGETFETNEPHIEVKNS